MEEEIEWLYDEFSIDEEDVCEIFARHGSGFMDRGVVSCVFRDLLDCAYEEAHALGYANDQNDRWFHYERFGNDLLNDGERYVELSDGRIAVLNL